MIKLIEATLEYEDELKAFKQEILEYDANSDDRFAGCKGLAESKTAADWIKLCQLRKNESTCKEVGAEVPSTTYFAIRESDHKLVGIIDLRHHINHPLFSSWAGHCGCSVRPSERGRGYAKEMLRLNLKNAHNIGIDKILVTCLTKNDASEHTILANNGIYENTIEVDGFLIKRYWIKTKP